MPYAHRARLWRAFLSFLHLQPQLYKPADGFGLSQLALCPISGGFRIGEPVSLTVASGATTAGRIGSGPGSAASDVRTAFLRAQISAIRFCRSADFSRRMRVRTSHNCSMVHPSRHATPISGLRFLVVTDWMLVHICLKNISPVRWLEVRVKCRSCRKVGRRSVSKSESHVFQCLISRRGLCSFAPIYSGIIDGNDLFVYAHLLAIIMYRFFAHRKIVVVDYNEPSWCQFWVQWNQRIHR
jgi:hypothetical protein